jgi:hypothetical protein
LIVFLGGFIMSQVAAPGAAFSTTSPLKRSPSEERITIRGEVTRALTTATENIGAPVDGQSKVFVNTLVSSPAVVSTGFATDSLSANLGLKYKELFANSISQANFIEAVVALVQQHNTEATAPAPGVKLAPVDSGVKGQEGAQLAEAALLRETPGQA